MPSHKAEQMREEYLRLRERTPLYGSLRVCTYATCPSTGQLSEDLQNVDQCVAEDMRKLERPREAAGRLVQSQRSQSQLREAAVSSDTCPLSSTVCPSV